MSTTALVSIAVTLLAAQDTTRVPVRPVAEVELARYAGRWHEVARLPNRFQAKCIGETTADYELLEKEQMRVVNVCRKADGSLTRAEGRARPAKREGPASKLKVRFAPKILSFMSAVWGNYWILDLTESYDAALVGDPSRKYLWILSRTPRMDPAIYERMVATARKQGFAVEKLIVAPEQSGISPSSPASAP